MRFPSFGLLLSGVVVASSACSIDATAPASLAAPASAVMAKGTQAGNWQDGPRSGSPLVYTTTIDPRRRNVLHFGAHTLDIGEKAICDAPSGYGLALFDQTCRSEKSRVTITAVVRTSTDGMPRIDLLPEIRFSPTSVVTLTLHVQGPTFDVTQPRILYCPSASSIVCIDESLLDPTLATFVDAQSHTVFRRIKHFSGYYLDN